MATKLDIAKRLAGGSASRSPGTRVGAFSPPTTARFATVTAYDSATSTATVLIDGSDPDDVDSVVTLHTDSPVAVGDRASVMRGAGGFGKLVSLAETQRRLATAKAVADEAQAVAAATGQHFFDDDSGAHVTDVTREEWDEQVASETPFDDESDAKPYHNVLINSLGILMRRALKHLVSITRSAIAFYDGEGNAASNVTASFGPDGAQVGKSGEGHVAITKAKTTFHGYDGSRAARIGSSNDETTGLATVTETGFAVSGSFGGTQGWGISLSCRVVEVVSATLDGAATAVAIAPSGYAVTCASVTEDWHVLEVTYTTRSVVASCELGSADATGPYSVATGHWSTASGANSLASGNNVTAAGGGAQALGEATTASGEAAHAEGSGTRASGNHAHAEGHETVASGLNSHAGGIGTVAAGMEQVAIGRYNVEDANGDYALVIGNGSGDSSRSNALAVDWDGNLAQVGSLGLVGYVDSDVNITSGTVIAANTGVYCRVNLPSGAVPIGVVALATTTADSYLTYTLVHSGSTVYVRVMNRGANSITCGGGGVRVWYVMSDRI